MSLICDVCKSAVPDGVRFCPRCGLEIVPERERTSRPTPMEKDVFDWDETPGHSKQYDVSERQVTGLTPERAAELLRLAETRLGEGQVLEAIGLLKQVKPQAARDATLRAAFERIARKIDEKRQAIRQRCESLARANDSERLVALLAGQAANELEPEEVCSIALDAARTMFRSHHADGAAEVLRLVPFRTVREEELVRAHRELELQVHRMRARQHAVRGFLLVGGVLVAAAIGLSLFAWTLWFGDRRIILWILVPLLLIVVALVAFIPQLREWVLSKVGKSNGRARTSGKLAGFSRERRK
jgi:hypothetical protein